MILIIACSDEMNCFCFFCILKSPYLLCLYKMYITLPPVFSFVYTYYFGTIDDILSCLI